MVQTSPSPFDVGRAFVHQYYTLLHQAPQLLHRFYSTDSTFIHGGVDRPGSIERTAVGPDDIARRIGELNLRDCHAKIRQVDSHPTIGNGVVVQVTGELSNNGHPMRRFMQTFVLAPRQPKKYYVQNDIFRYQDEVFDDVSDEDDRSSSQNYGDTVSNADSSAAITQQPLLVAATSRDAPEEEQQEQQPLPPRDVNNQQQVISNQTVQQQEPPLNGLNESTGYNGQQEAVQENQQQIKQITTEGTSYAGVAKLHPTTGLTSNVISTGSVSMPPPQPTNTTRSTNVKSASNRINNQQRGQNNYYPSNNRANQWPGNNQQDPSPGRRPGSNMATVSNEQQVFVGSLPLGFTRENLIECFSQFGHVREAKIQMPVHDNKKNFGFVCFDDPEVASEVVKMEHIMYNNIRLNVEPKTQRGYQGNANNGPQGGARNNNYQTRGGGGGVNRGGNRGAFRGNANNQRRGGGGGGQHRNNSPSFTGRDENNKAQKQQQQQPQQQQ
ncbi:unnamed protein product [Rotaria sp. Silwood2]|nr:unnamed protein product [Rotaria sp. Silwood2]CAF2594192.1 unnamed protein product [Rotaria sp. Silwood2]CAF2978793.1 unnamed protein product [Rotaria sp. Silwood2]CAF4158920.1 unnamed protein product [Rotaria sp. Silwood2]CAF4383236.1 unnamed protein product [Rotaria sp. Silwood2]